MISGWFTYDEDPKGGDRLAIVTLVIVLVCIALGLIFPKLRGSSKEKKTPIELQEKNEERRNLNEKE